MTENSQPEQTEQQPQIDMSPEGHHKRATMAIANINQCLGRCTGIPAPVTAFMWSDWVQTIQQYLAMAGPKKTPEDDTPDDQKDKNQKPKPSRPRGKKAQKKNQPASRLRRPRIKKNA